MKRMFLCIVWSVLFVAVGVIMSQAATNDQYCVNPVYSINPVKPNVLILQDLSGSMTYTAYMPDGNTAAGLPYSANKNYFGLFDNELCYQYTASNRFESVTGCDCSDQIGSSACISGRILNWATASRIDTAKKALTGGKLYGSTTDVLQSEGGSVPAYTQILPGDDKGCVFSINSSRQLTIKNGTTSTCSCVMVDDPPCVNQNYNCRWQGHGQNRRWVCDTRCVMPQHQECTPVGCVPGGGTCNLGDSVISNANIRVKVDDVATIGGLVESFSDRVNFEYMTYNTDAVGKMVAGKGVTETALIAAINGSAPPSAFVSTPTGSALKAAYKWYTQGTAYDSTSIYDNGSFIDKTNTSNDKDPYFDGVGGDAVSVPCRSSFILLLSDGQYNSGSDPAPVAHALHTTDLRSGTGDVAGTQSVTTYSVYLYGDGVAGSNSMKTIAAFGGFDLSGETTPFPYTFTSAPSDSRTVTWPRTNCNPSGTWNSGASECPEWDKSTSPHTGLPHNYFEASNGDELVVGITSALNDMVRKASSGTAASVLGSSEGSGANLIQSFYYPKRTYTNGDITWMGAMQNLWFYIDPTLGSSTMREDTTGNSILDFTGDCIIEYEFDTSSYKTMVHKYQPTTTGSKGTEGAGSCSPSPVEIDAVDPLWEAGAMLWKRDLSTSPRTIFTNVSSTKTPFTTAYADPLYNYMDPPGTSTSDKIAAATDIISYIGGNHVDGFRNRTVQMTYEGTEDTRVWKLGDIISSTPRMKSSIPINSYHAGSPDGYADATYREYVNSSDYKRRGMVYVGANDGMLHAFDMGNISYTGLSAGQVAKINTTDLVTDAAIVPGTEQWAFIPKNVLPYLKYLADPQYCHMYFVDAPVTLVDASVVVSTESPVCDGKPNCKQADSWRTILIGGMGNGGACRNTSQACAGGGTECTKTPISDVGFSSYFAIDVTDPTSPSLLWEFSSDELGYSTTGPAIVRTGNPDETGNWYVVFANGPTGTVDTSYNQLKARSDQYLKLFAFDLYTGPGASNGNVTTITTTIANAFGGSLSNATIDVDKGRQETGSPYSDDVFYLGYTKKDITTWTKGGVIRVMTNNNTNPAYWTWSKVIDDIGPVTGSVSKLQDRNNSNLWLYFGTGRYWYRTNEIDSASDQQALYGIKEPCYSYDNQMKNGCDTTLLTSDLSNKSGNVAASTTGISTPGWYINLEVPSTTYKAERMITGPVALNNGVVIFTTIEPSADICSMGGTTFVWVTWYNNGTAPPASALTGQVMVQVSSGRIALKGLGGISTDTGHTGADGGRTISLGEGGTSGGSGGSVIVGPRPLQKILHIRER